MYRFLTELLVNLLANVLADLVLRVLKVLQIPPWI